MIRKATIKDAKKIKQLIDYYARKDFLLPRSLSEVYENIRDFFVYEENRKIVGCCALRVCWEDLAEVKSMAVLPQKKKQGIGKSLLEAAVEEAKGVGVKKVFVLTCAPEYFKKYGFKRINKSKLPHKIWSECIKCPKFPNCDEVPLIMDLK